MKKLFVTLIFFAGISAAASAQEYFTIQQYDISVKVNKDATLDITETINVHFTASRHGIFRMIPVNYKLAPLAPGTEKADRQLESNGKAQTFLEDISVEGWDYSVNNKGDYKEIKIGNKKIWVDGDQEYIIHYKLLNAINFFKDKSELYFNAIGDKWETTIEKVNVTIELYNALPAEPSFFVATGYTGSKENNSVSKWTGNRIFTASTTKSLRSYEGVTVGVVFPKDYLTKQNFMLRGLKWLIMPAIVFFLMFVIWSKWGKDEKLTVTTEFYPPKDVSPSVAGYIIDDTLDKRDLTALVPYWGAGGYLKIRETGKSDYEFIKVKDLPGSALTFERTLFNGIFASGDNVMLSSLKNVLYSSMNSAKSQLEGEVNKNDYYTPGSRGMSGFFVLLGLVSLGYGGYHLFKYWGDPVWFSLAFIASGIITIAFGLPMAKKTRKGNELYQKLAGFKEFITMVEKPRLEQFLKEDKDYVDKVLPFAIVFDVADKWKDKLKDLDIPPPNWYAGNYSGFTTYMFLSSLNRSMNTMSENFYSTPSSSGSSGGSWSSGGGGGFSGGGFGGGGGGSW